MMSGRAVPSPVAALAAGAPGSDRSLLEAFFMTSPAGVALFDLELRLVYANPAMAALVGGADVTGCRLDEVLGDEARPLLDGLAMVIDTGEVGPEHRIALRRGDRAVNLLVSYHPIVDASGALANVGAVVVDVTGLGGVSEAEEAEVARAQSDRIALAGLQATTVAVAEATSIDGVVDVVLGVGREAARASAGVVALLDEDGAVVRVAGAARAAGTSASSLPVTAGMDISSPLGRTVATGEAVFCSSPEELHRAFPEMTGPVVTPGEAAVAALPLRAGSRLLGAMVLSFDEPQEFRAEQVATLTAMADLSAAALWRVALLEREERARAVAAAAAERNAFLAEATALVSAPLDEGRVLDRLARLCVPRLGDWCSITRPHGDVLERVLVHHHDPELAATARRLLRTTVRLDDDAHPVARAFMTGTPELLVDIDVATDPSLRDVVRRLGSRRGVVVPIGPRQRPAGVLAFAVGGDRTLTDDDLELAAEIALRAGIAVEHAESFARERDVAALLQRAILPAALPSVPGIGVAATYRPAGSQRTVGGDWFDAFKLVDGRLALVVGDVAGHGIAAAAAMAQLRNGLRAYLMEGHPPGRALALLNRLLTGEGPRQHATVVTAIVDVAAGHVVLATAGHLPPVLAEARGPARLVDLRGGPMLGALPDATYPEQQFPLAPGSTLVLYTDGLVERRHQSLDTTMADLRDAIARNPPGSHDLAGWCDRLVSSQLTDREHDDDSCVLVLRAAGDEAGPTRRSTPLGPGDAVAGGALRWDLPVDAGSARLLRQWLAAAYADHPRLDELQLCATELVVNAVIHANPPLSVTVEDDGHVTRVAVHDGSAAIPRTKNLSPTAPTGRGLRLLDALADDWGVVVDATGKVVWLEFAR